jgi:probable phosphoglycerate mutase
LTKRGIQQIQAVSEALKKEKIQTIYTSQLSRSYLTGKEINKNHNVKIHSLKVLNERCFGKLENFKGPDIHKKFPNALKDPFFRPKNGENMNDLIKRLKPFVNKYIYNSKHKTICIATHGALNRALFSILLDMDIKKAYDLKLHHTSITKLKIQRKKAKIIRFNNINHLKKLKIKTLKELRGVA